MSTRGVPEGVLVGKSDTLKVYSDWVVLQRMSSRVNILLKKDRTEDK